VTTSSTKNFRKHENICRLLNIPITCPHCGVVLDDRDNSKKLKRETEIKTKNDSNR